MEYVDGRNLKEIRARCAERGILLPIDFAAYVAHVIAEALAHAHEGWDEDGRLLGIVHADVSPSNVFISRLGVIKLGDFGVARLLPGSPQAAAYPFLSQAEVPAGPGAFGKIHYLAPELLRGGRPTPASDSFALGAVFFELLTNQRAFPGRDVNEVGQRILPRSGRPPRPFARGCRWSSTPWCSPVCSGNQGGGFDTASRFAADVAMAYNPSVGTPLAIAAVVRGLFGAEG